MKTDFQSRAAATVYNELHDFARYLTKDPDTAQDLMQDTLINAITKEHLFEPGSNLKGWLITIMRNHFINQYRNKQRKGQAGTVRLSPAVVIGTEIVTLAV